MALEPLHVALGIVAGVDDSVLDRLRAIQRQDLHAASNLGPSLFDALVEILSRDAAEAIDVGIVLRLAAAWPTLRSKLIYDRATTPALAFENRSSLLDSLYEVPRELELPIELKPQVVKVEPVRRGDKAMLDTAARKAFPGGRPIEMSAGRYREALRGTLKTMGVKNPPTDKTFRKHGH